MPQAYADRVAARPGYARFKNRKKELRRQLRAGRISPDEHADLMDLARAEYRDGAGGDAAGVLDAETQAKVDKLKADIADDWLPCTNDWCLAATGRTCICECEGRWHGVAVGNPPLMQWRTIKCDYCGRETPDGPRKRFCGYQCQLAWQRRENRRRWQQTVKRRRCPTCGLRFSIPYKRPNTRYCSPDCQREAHNRRCREAKRAARAAA